MLLLSDSRASCDRFAVAVASRLACVHTGSRTRAPTHNASVWRGVWAPKFYFYHARKWLLARLAVDLGLNVLQARGYF